MSRKADLIACVILALFAAFIIGAACVSQADLLGTVLVVATASATLGFVFPRHVIFTAAILGFAAPLAHLLARLNHWTTDASPSSLWWTLLAILPALAAAIVGGATRRLIAARSRPAQP